MHFTESVCPIKVIQWIRPISADAVRYVLTAANQGQHNYRSKVMTGGAHPLMLAGEDKGGMYAGGVRVESSRIRQRG